MKAKMLKYGIILVSLALSLEVSAQISKWVDEKGITHFTYKPEFSDKKLGASPEKKDVDESKENQRELDEETALKEADAAFKSSDYARALALLKPLAERGNLRAQNGIGLIYGRGLGVTRDLREAFMWHQKAANQGYGLAQYYVGLMYADGQGVRRDAAEGAKWLRKAAEQGIANAQFVLGVMYTKGEGVEKDSRQAAEWYRKAAEQGHAFAQHNLALLYASGDGVAQDNAAALRWEQQAAEHGDPSAQYRLGTLYAKGQEISQNYAEAYKWFREAAKQGYPLGFDFERGWTVGHYAEVPNQYIIAEFIRKGDDINNWKELFTIQTFFTSSWGGASPEDTFNRLKAIREKTCPEATNWNVIGKDESSILYEWQARPCLGWPDQHEIARIIYGNYSRFRLAYSVKTHQMPPQQRTKWIRKLLETKIGVSLR